MAGIKIYHIFSFLMVISSTLCLPEQGVFDVTFKKEDSSINIPTTLFAGSKIFVQITCDAKDPNTQVQIFWELAQNRCWQDNANMEPLRLSTNDTVYRRSEPFTAICSAGGHIILPEFRLGDGLTPTEVRSIRDEPSKTKESEVEAKKPVSITPEIRGKTDTPLLTILKDGFYKFSLHIKTIINDQDFNASVRIEMRGPHGLLSAADWPLLPFYGTMCLVYVVFGVIWLVVSFLQWRDLLRIQFWIGGVIVLGMLEKAVFYAEYQSINSTGVPVQAVEVLAEWGSCAKRTLARMLVIIVSLGFGIVKPRLGPMLHRVVGTGALYFILASVEGYLRVMRVKSVQSNQTLVASIPLAVLDSGICWWIFTSLVQTTRTLRLRRNMVKLSLYRHFTNTLIFSVIASVFFMLYSIKSHQLTRCSTDWREFWIDEAFWHILFSVLLLVIMILWRPTNNNQRYAFTPLLDNPDDEDDDDDEEDQFVSDAYGVKMRGAYANNSPKPNAQKASTTEEDDLRWVEENIPSAIADAALPVLDSDEEIINTKFEVSKMQ